MTGPRSPTAAGRRDALVTGLLDGLEELDVYGAATTRRREIERADQEVGRAGQGAASASGFGVAAVGLAGAVSVGLMALSGAVSPRAGGIWFGVLVVTGLAVFEMLGTLPGAGAALGRCVAGLARVQAVLDAAPPVPEPTGAAVPLSGPIGLSVRGVSVAPTPGAPFVLTDVDVEVAPGERVALVGPSGSGKSTLLAAVLRLLPTDGPVELVAPDRRVAVARPPSGRRGAAWWPARSRATTCSPRRCGTTCAWCAPTASDADLDQVAVRAGLGRWVHTLPDGWSTQAGADGAQLSGGQRQRFLVARALLADPAILVLDEPTAHLDESTAAEVMADLTTATAGRTVILSTHRLAGLTEVDQLLRVADGRVQAVGAAADADPRRLTPNREPTQVPGARPRRARASMVTAASSTRAVTTYLAAALKPSRPMPLSMAAMTRPPSTAWIGLPRPPNRLVPPMTAAATA